MKCAFSKSECLTSPSANVVTITPAGSLPAETAPFKTVLLTNVRLAALAMGSGAIGTLSAAFSSNPSSVRLPMLLNRHDSSVRLGNGNEANFSYAARLRSSHQPGAEAWLARCDAKISGAKLPIGERVTVAGTETGEDIAKFRIAD